MFGCGLVDLYLKFIKDIFGFVLYCVVVGGKEG